MRGRKPKPTNLAVLEGNPSKRALAEGEPKPETEHLPVPGRFAELGEIGELATEVWEALMPELVRWGIVSRMDQHLLEVYVIAVARKEHADEQVAKSGPLVKTPNGYWAHNPFLSISNKQAEIIRSVGSEFGLSPVARVRLAGTAQGELPFDDLGAYERGN